MTSIEPPLAVLTGDPSPRAVRERVPPVLVIVEIQEPRPGESSLVVSTPDGSRRTIQIADSARASALGEELPERCKPLAVRFQMSEREPLCTCVVTTPRGPDRITLSVPAALSLVRAGVHGIVTAGSTHPPNSATVRDVPDQ